LISGHFVVSLTDGTAELRQQGDYVMWGPGIDHSWKAYEDSVVMTVRWPSMPLPTN
jgi:quercetin dioxygenase-like cupin family protein